MPSSSSNHNPLFNRRARSISKQILANLVLEREDMNSSTLRSHPKGSVMDSNASPSQNSTWRLWSYTHTIAFESLVVAGSKYDCHEAIWSVIPFTFQGPPKMIFCFISSVLHLINKKPFSISNISIRPNSCHWPNRVVLTYSKAGALLNNLAYKVCWLALSLISSSTWKTSITLFFNFSKIAPSTGRDEFT